MQFTTPRHFENSIVIRRRYTQGHIRFQFAIQSFTQLATGDELAFTAGKWRRIDHEIHRQRRFIDRQHRQGFRMFRIANRRTDVNRFNSVDQHDVASGRFIDDLAFQSLERKDLIDTCLDRRRIRTI